MKYWIRLLLLVGALIGVVIAIGSLLPRGYSLSSTVDISARPDQVYQLIDSTPKWKEWSHWNPDVVKDLQVDYSTDGKAQTWTDVRGSGKLWFVQQIENEQIDYKSLYANFPEMDSSIKLAANGQRTSVTWTSDGRLPGGAFYGFFRAVFVNGMNMQYQQSLDKLKELAEQKQAD